MKAIILAGGLGTRLRPLTLSTPKALLPILSTPLIYHQFQGLKSAGVNEIILASGPQTPIFKKELQTIRGEKLNLRFAHEKKLLGTGGAIRFAYDLFHSSKTNYKPIIILNGDILFELNYRQFLRFHQKKNAECSIALTQVPDASRFGLVQYSKDGRIKKFIEKPKKCRGKRWINAGAYIINPELIQMIPQHRPVSVEREIFPMFLENGLKLFAYRTKGYWNDIGTPQTYLKAHHDLWAQKKYWTENSLLRKRGALVGNNCRISPGASMTGHVCIGNDASIGPGVKLKDSVIFDGVRIHMGAEISGAIIGKNCVIGEFSQIAEGAVLGDETKIPSYTRC